MFQTSISLALSLMFLSGSAFFILPIGRPTLLSTVSTFTPPATADICLLQPE